MPPGFTLTPLRYPTDQSGAMGVVEFLARQPIPHPCANGSKWQACETHCKPTQRCGGAPLHGRLCAGMPKPPRPFIESPATVRHSQDFTVRHVNCSGRTALDRATLHKRARLQRCRMKLYDGLTQAASQSRTRSLREIWFEFETWERSRNFSDDPSRPAKQALDSIILLNWTMQ